MRPERAVRVGFGDIERVLGFPLPDSRGEHQAHRFSYQGSAVARAIIDTGWTASRAQLSGQAVTPVPGPAPGRR